MTDTPMKLIVNCETGVQELIPFTPEEIAQAEVDRLAYEEAEAARVAEEEALANLKASAKAKLVSGQPLTEEEASVLIV
jgi:predicted DNA-binding protein (UPF0251 family)